MSGMPIQKVIVAATRSDMVGCRGLVQLTEFRQSLDELTDPGIYIMTMNKPLGMGYSSQDVLGGATDRPNINMHGAVKVRGTEGKVHWWALPCCTHRRMATATQRGP